MKRFKHYWEHLTVGQKWTWIVLFPVGLIIALLASLGWIFVKSFALVADFYDEVIR